MQSLTKEHNPVSQREQFHILRIDRGEKIMASLLDYIRKYEIKSGTLTGIGATSSATIGWFDPVKEVYENRTIEEPCEITTLVGNVAWFEDDPVAHTHITLGLRDYSVVGGHLVEATVGVTCEIWIMESGMQVKRTVNPIGGLKFLDLSIR